MLKMKDDPAICMKTKLERKNYRRNSGHKYITEQEFGDIFDLVVALVTAGRLFREVAKLAPGSENDLERHLGGACRQDAGVTECRRPGSYGLTENVKNEGASGYMHENTGEAQNSAMKNPPFSAKSRLISAGFVVIKSIRFDRGGDSNYV